MQVRPTSINIIVRFTALKKLNGFERIKFFKRFGTQAQARDYCAKGEQTHKEWLLHGIKGPNYGKNAKFEEYGELTPGRAAKGTFDMQQIYTMVVGQKTDTEIAEIAFGPFSRSLRAIDRIRAQNPPQCLTKREIILVYGDSDIGKTRWAKDTFSDLWEMPINSQSGTWFDGYYNQETALIDEFSGQMHLDQALRLLDPWYVRMVNVKTSFVWWNPKRIIVTTNIHPSLWYKWAGRENQQFSLRRRFTEIRGWTHLANGLVGLAPLNIHKFWPLGEDKTHNRFVWEPREDNLSEFVQQIPIHPFWPVDASTSPHMHPHTGLTYNQEMY